MDVFVMRGMPDLHTTMPDPGGMSPASCGRWDKTSGRTGRQARGAFPAIPEGACAAKRQWRYANHRGGQTAADSQFLTASIRCRSCLADCLWHVASNAVTPRGHVKAGEKVLILGASGGVGVSCVQFAKMAGAEVFACTSSEEKGRKAERLGADHIINYIETPEFSRRSGRRAARRASMSPSIFTGGDTWIQTSAAWRWAGAS